MKKILLASVLALVMLLGLWFYARPAYQRHRETRAIALARGYLAKGDYQNASLSARQALRVNPSNLEACRMMTDLAEQSHSPCVLDWRRRIVDLAPTVDNRLKLASTALRSQGPPYPLAAQTLDELKDTAASVAAYHVVSAELALRLKRSAVALDHFERASRLDPTNELYQLNLAVLQLQSTNAAALPAARSTLERLRASSNVGVVALRWLVSEHLRRDDLNSAQQFSRQLLANPHSQSDDRLQHLGILRQSNSSEFGAYLTVLQKNALTNAMEIYGISAWLIGHGLVDGALGWLTHCPAKLQAEQPVPLALVDCLVAKRDWVGLETALSQQKWGELEFLRQAFWSRAAFEQNQKLAADMRWRTAVRETGDRLGPKTALLSLATSWGRPQAREDLLWQIAHRFPRERWALRELERSYLAAGNTLGLNKVYSALASFDPKNLAIKNNLAATSLLLRINVPRAHELARELFSQHPEEAIVASTYAFSLHLQGRTKPGLAALDKLKPEALETPSVALYYGLLLSATDQTNQAGKYLRIAQRSELLPEEKALVGEALKQIGPRA